MSILIERKVIKMTEDRAISLNAVLKCLTATNLKKFDFIEDAREQIKQLPPVTPNDEEMAMQYQRGYIDGFKEGKATFEPKTGHWIVEVWNNREHHTCSVCQKVVDYEPCYHYCPYCGAKMVEEQEGAKNDKRND